LMGKPLVNLFLYAGSNKIKCTISTLSVIQVYDVLLQKIGKDTEAHQVLTCAARCQQMSSKVSWIQQCEDWLPNGLNNSGDQMQQNSYVGHLFTYFSSNNLISLVCLFFIFHLAHSINLFIQIFVFQFIGILIYLSISTYIYRYIYICMIFTHANNWHFRTLEHLNNKNYSILILINIKNFTYCWLMLGTFS
jgi:hypothetical protein